MEGKEDKSYLTGNIYLRDFLRYNTDDFRYRGHFEGGTNDKNEIDSITVVVHKTGMELLGEIFAEECYVWLHLL